MTYNISTSRVIKNSSIPGPSIHLPPHSHYSVLHCFEHWKNSPADLGHRAVLSHVYASS